MRAELKSRNATGLVRNVGAAILIAATLAISPAVAADREFSKDFETCLDEAAGVTPAMIDCI
jgi:hypothetical protein